jgi:hypothetical protein
MTTIYDDVEYIEIVNSMNENQDIINQDECQNKYKYQAENEEDFIEFIESINQKKMFERLLKETMDELNKTNPCLESGKYHMLCIYSNRYDMIINKINYKILRYEFKRLMKARNHCKCKQWHWICYWTWSWKLMSYFKVSNIEKEEPIIYKNSRDKKKD